MHQKALHILDWIFRITKFKPNGLSSFSPGLPRSAATLGHGRFKHSYPERVSHILAQEEHHRPQYFKELRFATCSGTAKEVPDVKFEATLAGAIHGITIRGVIAV